MELPTNELRSGAMSVFGSFDTRLITHGQAGDIISTEGKIIEGVSLTSFNPEVARRVSEEAFRIVMETQPFLI
jgi:hypothetical protein